MNAMLRQESTPPRDARLDQVLKLAIFAVGGQGGGVLNSWIIHLAEANGYNVQATSVAGVAQRTGSTIYYVEMLPVSDGVPVFALAPTEGDIDIVIAAEVMEAGRAMMRGFIAPGRTTVIASTHRQLATQEKVVPGNGTADSSPVMDALIDQAEILQAFDMQTIAEEEGTVISAALFGALAGSGALPFSVERFRETLRASGRGVDKSLAAFERACEIARGEAPAKPAETPTKDIVDRLPVGPKAQLAAWADLDARLRALPTSVRDMAELGLRKTIEFQDIPYGDDYLTRIEQILKADDDADGAEAKYDFTRNAAKYLANALCYDDIVRVAAAKTQPGRLKRIEEEVGAGSTHITLVTEYTHPGADEIVSLLPQRFGTWFEHGKGRMRVLDCIVNKGRHIRTDRLVGFLSFYVLAGLRGRRRGMLRHRREMDHIDAWLLLCLARLPRNYDLAVESLKTRRLIKGYSDTHARGQAKFDKVVDASKLVEDRSDAADWTRRLIDAAMTDPSMKGLDGAIATIQSFAPQPEN